MTSEGTRTTDVSRDEGTRATVAIFGAGVMGETLLSGLLRAGRRAEDLVITERRPERIDELRDRYPGVRILDNVDAAELAEVLVLVVKPQDMAGLLLEISEHVRPGNLVVSLAAGITTQFLESHLPNGSSVVRVMPNTPALVDQGMAALSSGGHCTAEHMAEAMELLQSCGRAIEVPEKYQDAVTAISGSGPAYVFYVVEAMIEAGVVLGLPRATATELVVQTLFGAATMIKETGQHPTVLREQVTSPGGTTAAALRQLDDHKVRAAFITAMEAAAARSAELSGQ
ncbi:pyrroline-5-carboxylate reductase [Nostocoides sp. F2B08]|uniref:pyrroline-5-carboxylate reductase n=1 Tax=Nostocoides sp. F2B08 TaxID=2653936 RepID=UPI001D046B85|nr:pyrroline-5-carboxylate reductase [Tetrasphaera sp. F2B08]